MDKKVGAIVLAAGKSQRMGQDKIFCNFRQRTMIAHVLDMLESCNIAGTIIVLGHHYQNALAYLATIPEAETSAIMINLDYEKGMGSSLSVGLQAVPSDWWAVLVVLGDMPLIQSNSIIQILRAFDQSKLVAPIIVPTFQGRKGHPVLFSREYFEELGQINGDFGGRLIIQKYPQHIEMIETTDPYILTDIDTKEQLQQWNL